MDHIVHFFHRLGIADPSGSGWIVVILTFAIAGLAVWRFMPRVRMFSLDVGWADQPNARRLNKEPLPNAGGLAIFAGVTVALVVTALLRPISIEHVQINVLAILLGGSFMIMAGFIDDQFGLPPVFRLLVQLIAALLLVSTGIRIGVGFGGQFAGTLSVLFTVLWIMAITNAMNLVDGVDGLAGGVSFITAMSLLAVSAQDQSKAGATLVLAAVAGAALGFLRHNLPPSRIIMGDSGAYFFGFVLAASSILGNLKITTAFSLFPTVLFLFVPLLDTIVVILRRLIKHKNPLSSPGKDHIHHGLLARGLSPGHTITLLLGVTLAANILAMGVQGLSVLVILVTTAGILVLLAVVTWRRRTAFLKAMARMKAQPGGAATPGTPAQGAVPQGAEAALAAPPSDPAMSPSPVPGNGKPAVDTAGAAEAASTADAVGAASGKHPLE
jgi:UDP-GlcNAc:undecaprenyl-phosphate/decaprenyl-phosphate GlcNAc-1-phosphate transferase